MTSYNPMNPPTRYLGSAIRPDGYNGSTIRAQLVLDRSGEVLEVYPFGACRSAFELGFHVDVARAQAAVRMSKYYTDFS